MGDYYFSKDISRWSVTNTGTNAGVSATRGATTGHVKNCTGIQCSSDVAAVVTVESPANTVLWQKRFTGAFTMSEGFPIGTLVGASGAAMLVKVSASSANCEANIQGISILG